MMSHLAKYRSLMPSLALLFELADRAAGGFDGFLGSIQGETQNLLTSPEHAGQAAAWCAFLETHARRVYAGVTSPQIVAARELAEHIQKKHVTNKDGGNDWFSARDVYLKGWRGLDSPVAALQALTVLRDAGWVRLEGVESPDPLGRGRSSERWTVNPQVWK
jgi:putative DNA primase/helicase